MKIKYVGFFLFFALLLPYLGQAQKTLRTFYQIKIYNISNANQENLLDNYLKEAYLPALHRQGINTIGVFKPVASSEDFGKKIYVIQTLKTQNQGNEIEKKLENDKDYQLNGKAYIEAKFDNKPYERFETIILQAFTDAPIMMLPILKDPKKERIYELRSYEAPTEKYYANKVKMFNEGGEIKLFKKLNFNAVFYGQVLVGSHMPNLMYMTTFENLADREAHWAAFGSSEEWTKLKAEPQYQNNISKNTQFFLFPTDYSDF